MTQLAKNPMTLHRLKSLWLSQDRVHQKEVMLFILGNRATLGALYLKTRICFLGGTRFSWPQVTRHYKSANKLFAATLQ